MLFVRFDLFTVAVSHLLRQVLVPSLVELANQLKTLLLHYAPLSRKSVVFPQRATATELVVELSKVDHRDGHEVEGVGAHDAGLDSHEQKARADLLPCHGLFHFEQAVDLAVAGSVLVPVGQIVTACYSHQLTLYLAGEDASNRNLVLLVALLCLLQGNSHPVLHLLRIGPILLLLSLHLRQFNKSNIIELSMENPQSSYLNLKHYVSVLAQLSFQAAQFAKECAENPDLGKYDKGGNDPVTDADYKIQTYLIKGITHFFPNIRIVGEETVDYKGQIKLNFESIRLDNYPQEAELDEKVPLEELCLWIDPIDNTKGFVKGKLEGVTILVGMTRKNSPILGFIATPYRKDQEKAYFSPYLYMGYVPKHKAFRLEGGQGQKWSRIEAPKANNPLVISSSERKSNDPVNEIAGKLNTQLKKFGGSGRKINAVITGSVDAMVYINTGNCRWDSCAGEAIVKAMGGVFTNQFGQDINYDANAEKYLNSEGNICTFNHELHRVIIDTYAQMAAEKK